MASTELPSRAKPDTLHTICRHLHEVQGSQKTDLYDQLDIDQRQIRAAVNYGAKLGFLTAEDDYVQNTDRGSGISYSENIKERPVQTAFREAIEYYAPYRDTLLLIQAKSLVEKINDNSAVKQSDLKEMANASTGGKHSDREINLLIKTAQAAGLGKFVTGRKGFETRLEVSDDFDDFIKELAEEYPTPEPEESVVEEEQQTEAEAGDETETLSAQVDEMALKADGAGEKLKLKVEYDVTNKSEAQISSLVKHIRSTE